MGRRSTVFDFIARLLVIGRSLSSILLDGSVRVVYILTITFTRQQEMSLDLFDMLVR